MNQTALTTSRRKIQAVLTARPGSEGALGELLRGMVVPSRAEPGNLRWDIWRDPEQPGRFVLDELYVDADAVAAHRASAHFAHYLSLVGGLAERQAHLVVPFDVAGDG